MLKKQSSNANNMPAKWEGAQSTPISTYKVLKTPRGSARRLRRENARREFPALPQHDAAFAVYWNGGKPSAESYNKAMRVRAKADVGIEHKEAA